MENFDVPSALEQVLTSILEKLDWARQNSRDLLQWGNAGDFESAYECMSPITRR